MSTDRGSQLPLPSGKVPGDLLERMLSEESALPPEVRLGPALGEDACALAVPEGVLVAATDPITLTGSDVGRLAVIVNANDIAVMGVRPRWFLATVMLPTGTTEADVVELFSVMREALRHVGAVLVGGHTEVTSAVTQPVVVGHMLGVSENDSFVTTGDARPGDILVQVGPAPLEGGGVLASEAVGHPGMADVGEATREAAVRALSDPGVSVVGAALAVSGLGVTAMHDPTEGGLAGALHELARAAGVAVRVDRAKVLWSPPAVRVCQALGADPWATLASGALLATFDPADAPAAVKHLTDRGHQAAAIGAIEGGRGVVDTEGDVIPWPDRDEVARILAT